MTRELPASFEANRIFVHPVTASGERLRLFTDTGGAMLFSEAAARRLGLRVDVVDVGGQEFRTVTLPAFAPDAWIPDIDHAADGRHAALGGRFILSDLPSTTVDGLLGQNWFGGRVWTIDYGSHRFAVGGESAGADTVPLGFARDASGSTVSHFPSIEASIDGETLPFLLDTGATLNLSPEAHRQVDDGDPAERGTCFIVASTFDRWRRRHPDWRVIDRADLSVVREPVIEVPAVTIAGHTIGPVWFSRRGDANFHDWMSQWMDRRVDGALGGSLFRYLRVTIDYPRAAATFERL